MTAILTAPLAARLRPLLPFRATARVFALLVIATVSIAGISSQNVLGLWAEARDNALDFVLAPLCEREPSPAVSLFQDRDEQQHLAQSLPGTAAR
jgi:hypothetical protein